MAGQPTKLNPEVQKRICDALRGGNTRRVAAILGGIAESTFYNWMDWANPENENHKPEYLEFLEAVTRAESEAEEFFVETLKTSGDWRASIEWLKRRKPKDWSEKQQLQQTVLNIDMSDFSDDELDRVINGDDPEQVYKESRTRREREAKESESGRKG